jgi:hypothetical protein
MTHVYERLLLKCPYVHARQYLRESLDDVTAQDEPQTLPLAAPRGFVPRVLERSVVVHFERARDPLHFDEPWRVDWTPDGEGPYPDFSGELRVRPDESYRGAILELTGDYAPPIGAVGRAFDMVIGERIASATARALLEQIGAQMEARYDRESA